MNGFEWPEPLEHLRSSIFATRAQRWSISDIVRLTRQTQIMAREIRSFVVSVEEG